MMLRHDANASAMRAQYHQRQQQQLYDSYVTIAEQSGRGGASWR